MMLLSLSMALPVGAAEGDGEAAGPPQVVLHTNVGDIRVELYPQQAPETVENFLQYVDSGFYDGTIFHRVVPGFVIQGGGFTSDMQQKRTRDPIQNEARNGLANERGTLSMARTRNPDSATSQFFVNLKDNAFLDPGGADPHGYAVFGRVVEGMDVVDRIAATPTGRRGPFSDVPQEVRVIESAERAGAEAGSAD